MNVTLSRQIAETSEPGAYRMDLTITSSEDTTKFLLVKQRTKKIDGTNNDEFVCVASPAQIEDINEGHPHKDECYFRDNSVSLVSSDPALLSEIFNEILADIQLTLTQLSELEELSPAEIFTITPDSITTG